MAELIEHLLRVDFHQIDVFYEEPEMPVKGRGVDRVDDRDEGAPVFVKELDRFFLELAFLELVHEFGLVDGLFPALAAFGGKLRDKLFGLAFVELEHGSVPLFALNTPIPYGSAIRLSRIVREMVAEREPSGIR